MRRAVIAEDSVLLRIGLVKVVEMAGFEVAAEVGDAQALLTAVEEHRPELAVVDVRMPPAFTDEGVRAALSIRQTRPSTAVLLLSQYVTAPGHRTPKKPVTCDGTPVRDRFTGKKSLRADVSGRPGATGMIAWRIDKV